MNNVIILVGISGSGKSTWTTELLKNSTEYIRCNRDDIRRTLMGDLVGYYGRRDLGGFEKLVTTIEQFIWKCAIIRSKAIIIDNTNLKIRTINNILKYFDVDYYDVKFKLFDCRLDIAKNRVIRRDFYNKYEDQITLDTDDIDLSKSPEVDYIDKQYEQYQSIKKWLLEVYPDKIIL